MGGAAGRAAATGFPLVSVARADSAKLKIGYIGCMSGPRTDFGVTAPWVLDRVKATLKDGLKIGGKNYAVEFILKDNQSDPNQTNVVAKELILGEKCDLVLTDDGENIAGAADELADARGVPLVSTLSPWEAWFFGRHGSPDKGFPVHVPLLHRRRRRVQSLRQHVEHREDQQGGRHHVHGFAGGTRLRRSATRSAADTEKVRLQGSSQPDTSRSPTTTSPTRSQR